MSGQPSNSNIQRGLWIAAALGAVLAVWMALSDRAGFFPAYLIAFLYWFGISLGALLISLVHGLTGGRWGEPIAAPMSAAARTMPLLAILFVPLAMNLDAIYAWAGNVRPSINAGEKSERAKEGAAAAIPEGVNRQYLNPDAFRIRAAIYFTCFCLFAWATTRRPSRAVGVRDAPRRKLPVAGWGLALSFACGTLAAVDWSMSLQAPWNSSIYGVLVVIGQCLLALAFLVLMTIVRPALGMADLSLSRDRLHDLGNLLLTLVMLWAYMGFSQYLIIWSGNLPDENVWYIPRTHRGWSWLPGFLMAFHFAVPFGLLLSREVKRKTTWMAWLALGLMFVRWLDVIWLVQPVFHPQGIWISLELIVAMVVVGSMWMIGFSLQFPIGSSRGNVADQMT